MKHDVRSLCGERNNEMVCLGAPFGVNEIYILEARQPKILKIRALVFA